jgi:uncharacterized protein (DUF488 family)
VTVFTIGHGVRALDELIATLAEAQVRTLIDVRRFPGSRRNPHFNQPSLRDALREAGLDYRHAVHLGGRLGAEPGEMRFHCIRAAAFRSYAARMCTDEWQLALAEALAAPAPCLMCAETVPWRCHRRLISELLVARGRTVVHLLGPARRQHHRLGAEAEARDGLLYLCGELVA